MTRMKREDRFKRYGPRRRLVYVYLLYLKDNGYSLYGINPTEFSEVVEAIMNRWTWDVSVFNAVDYETVYSAMTLAMRMSDPPLEIGTYVNLYSNQNGAIDLWHRHKKKWDNYLEDLKSTFFRVYARVR